MARKTDQAWEIIFKKKNLDVTQDLHFITAKDIKQLTRLEPRILAKFDHSNHLPPALSRHGYFLLPVKNGEYAIIRGEGFHKLEKINDSKTFKSRLKFEISTAGRGSGEMQYLDYAYYCGALEELLNTGPLYQSIRGREYTGNFSFRVKNKRLNVNSVQIEVDSGLEGQNDLVLLEAKIKTPEDFLIRQLFYPYKNFLSISGTKKIRPVFFTYELSSKTYNFWIYDFSDPDDYNSIRLVEQKSIKIDSARIIELDDIASMKVTGAAIVPPQADDFEKVVELVFKVGEGINDYKSIASYFGFAERQSSYYRQAAEALGLVYSRDGKYELTNEGKTLIKLSTIERSIFLSNLLRKFSLVNNALDMLNSKGKLSRDQLNTIIEQNSSLTGATIPRRGKTLFSWLKWIADHTKAFKVEGNNFTTKK